PVMSEARLGPEGVGFFLPGPGDTVAASQRVPMLARRAPTGPPPLQCSRLATRTRGRSAETYSGANVSLGEFAWTACLSEAAGVVHQPPFPPPVPAARAKPLDCP